MSAQPRPKPQPKPDDTRARIMETAETLFRRLGFAKTAVADIAGRAAHVAGQRLPLLPLQERDRRGDLPALPVGGRGEGLGGRALEGARRRSAWNG